MEQTEAVIPVPPLLTKYPAARCADRALVHGFIFPYLALLAGPLIAGGVAAYNAWALKRYGLAAGCLALAAAGWLLVPLLLKVVLAAGVTNPTVVVVCARLFALIPGVVLMLKLKPHIQGHQFLNGRLVAPDRAILVLFVVTLFLPGKILLFLLGIR